MEQRIFNPHNPEEFAKYNLGDIVVLRSFATHCKKVGDKFHFDTTAPINVSPFMVIIRADRNEKNFRTDKFKRSDFVRYRCMWYDPNKGDFQEAVFFEGTLMLVQAYNGKYNSEKQNIEKLFVYGDTANFRTRYFEMSKVFPEYNPYNRFREVVNFIPPDLTIGGFKIAKDMNSEGKHIISIKLNLKKGDAVVRYDCEERVLGQWYSTAQGKFLKRDFIPYTLEFVEIMTNFEQDKK